MPGVLPEMEGIPRPRRLEGGRGRAEAIQPDLALPFSVLDPAAHAEPAFVYAYGLIGRRVVMVRSLKRGGWEMPGGGVEGGEDPEAAVVREFEEETGMRFDPRYVFYTEEHGVPGAVFIGLAEEGAERGPIRSDEIAQVGAFDDLPRELAFPTVEYAAVLALARKLLGA